MGIINTANIPSVNASPNTNHYSNSVCICTDRTYYNEGGVSASVIN